MVMMTGMELPLRAIREQVTSAIHLVIQLSRFSDGSRKVTNVTEITGMEGQTITMQDIFAFKHEGIDGQGRVRGQLQSTGIPPDVLRAIRARGDSVAPGYVHGRQ